MIDDFIQNLKKSLAKPKKVIIIPHRNADADALGSSLALKLFLRKKNQKKDCRQLYREYE